MNELRCRNTIMTLCRPNASDAIIDNIGLNQTLAGVTGQQKAYSKERHWPGLINPCLGDIGPVS
jgi:hypothetical protein